MNANKLKTLKMLKYYLLFYLKLCIQMMGKFVLSLAITALYNKFPFLLSLPYINIIIYSMLHVVHGYESMLNE